MMQMRIPFLYRPGAGPPSVSRYHWMRCRKADRIAMQADGIPEREVPAQYNRGEKEKIPFLPAAAPIPKSNKP